MSFGILLTLTAMSIFPSESSWGSTYSVFGCIISLIGFSKFTKKFFSLASHSQIKSPGPHNFISKLLQTYKQ